MRLETGLAPHELTNSHMPIHHLVYAISNKGTPPSPKVVRQVLDVQTELNRRCTWNHERLALAPERGADRVPFGLPIVRFASLYRGSFGRAGSDGFASGAPRIPDAAAAGSTKVSDLWNAHLVVAFLRHVSREHPELHLELRNESGFVLGGAVTLRAGKVELSREWLNRERERVLEVTGDMNAAAPFVWAEAEALQGRFFLDEPVSSHAEVTEIGDLLNWDDLERLSLADAADIVVDRVLSERTLAAV